MLWPGDVLRRGGVLLQALLLPYRRRLGLTPREDLEVGRGRILGMAFGCASCFCGVRGLRGAFVWIGLVLEVGRL